MGLLKRRACPECGVRFSRAEELMNHQQLVHGKGGYDCRVCGVYFSSMEAMRTHLQRMHRYER